MKTLLSAVLIFGALALNTAVHAGELNYAAGKGGWTITDCRKPTAPELDPSNTEALNRAVNNYANYVADVNTYTACLSRAAERDIKRINAIILDGMRAAQNEALREADDLRVQLFSRTE